MTSAEVQGRLLAALRAPQKSGRLAPLFPSQMRTQLISILEGTEPIPEVMPGWRPGSSIAALMFCLGAAWAARFLGEVGRE